MLTLFKGNLCSTSTVKNLRATSCKNISRKRIKVLQNASNYDKYRNYVIEICIIPLQSPHN